MIIIICGKPGVGKTALNTCFALWEMQTNGALRRKHSIEKINALQAKYGVTLALPEIPPIYMNYDAKFHVGYKKYIEPYKVNPFYLGLPNGNMPTQLIVPYGELHITEGQDYWDSRESATFPRFVSKWFETHRHFGLDIYIDVQRAKLIDKNIRKLANKIIEVQRMILVKDAYRRTKQTVWDCKEFADTGTYETYDDGGYAPYRNTRYVYEGDIFESFNSRSCEEDFVPKGGKNFTFLKQLSSREIAALPEAEKQFYLSEMPKGYRSKPKSEDDGKD